MATVVPHKNKEGKIVSYQIQVFRGRDASGKKLKPYTMSWKVPETYKTKKSIQKALEKAVGEFETSCKRGEVTTDKRTLEDYARYFIQMSQRDSKRKSVDFYNSLMPRISVDLGHIRLSGLTAEHLNKFYLKLQTEDVRKDKKAIAKDMLLKIKKERKLTNVRLQAMTNLSGNTIKIACQQKRVALETAVKIAAALVMNMDSLFDIVTHDGQKGLSAKSINHYHTFIHAVLQQAKREGVVRDNVADMALPPRVKKKEAEFFEIDEIIAIREALDHEPLKYRIMIYLLTDTGIRRGELFGIRWKSVDFKNNTICIENNIQWSKGKGLYADTTKGGKARTVSIAPEIVKELKAYKAEQNKWKLSIGDADYNKDGYLFIQENGTVMNPSSLNLWMRGFKKRNKLPHIYPHKFRHSQASILYASGVDVVTISNRLGHKQVSTTQNIYAHIMKDSDRKASDAIAAALYRNNA